MAKKVKRCNIFRCKKIVILIILGILTTLTENGTASDKYQNVANMAKPKNNFDGMVLILGS